MFRLVLFIIGAYIFYKLVFDFIIPLYKASTKLHSHIRNAQDEMNRYGQKRSPESSEKTSRSTPPSEDYIEFEDIK